MIYSRCRSLFQSLSRRELSGFLLVVSWQLLLKVPSKDGMTELDINIVHRILLHCSELCLSTPCTWRYMAAAVDIISFFAVHLGNANLQVISAV